MKKPVSMPTANEDLLVADGPMGDLISRTFEVADSQLRRLEGILLKYSLEMVAALAGTLTGTSERSRARDSSQAASRFSTHRSHEAKVIVLCHYVWG